MTSGFRIGAACAATLAFVVVFAGGMSTPWAVAKQVRPAPGAWMSVGRTTDEQRFSPLAQVDAVSVKGLGLAWYADIDTERGQEATPIVVDGVLYVTSAWSMVKAYDARTGAPLWAYDPKVDRGVGGVACCDVVNRGVAAWKGRIYLAALDGRLIALDGKTGAALWSVQTTDPKLPYTITAAPRIVKGRVIIGNAGAEYACRGYVSAYDAQTGKMVWRFYTVPGNPADGFETPELKRAAATWHGQWWKFGGGATVWDSVVYDPRTNLVYFGTGNGLSWDQELRSPGGGDNLFVSSIIAVNADTGRYAWHYQETPGDEWDFDNTNPLMLADLPLKSGRRHVLMQAPKNGFFYIWDARTGKLLSAEKFAPVNWAERIDRSTGRPVENPAIRYDRTGKPVIISPAPLGAHNWHPMSYSPLTGLVYFSVTESNAGFDAAKDFKFNPKTYNTGVNSAGAAALYAAPGAPQRGNIRSYLLAWNPVTQKEVWRAPNAVYGASGTLATAGGLVFSGDAAGHFDAYDARTGALIWSTPTQAGVVAAPSTYALGGVQYIALLVGARGLPAGVERTSAVSANNSRLLVYKLGGAVALPTATFVAPSTIGRTLNPPLLTATNEQVIDGQASYARVCSGCHGDNAVSVKSIPDLRYTTLLHDANAWNEVVLAGVRREKGMVSFRGQLADGEAEAIMAYVISRANQDKAAEQAKK